MPGDADFIQKVVHMLEAGKMAVCVKRSLGGVASATLGVLPFVLFSRPCYFPGDGFPTVSGLRIPHRDVELAG
ncbi:MAG: hypothetical protein DMF19_08940 [Verrucomicrobia bacterium]|nr:MAG: hypothetical protein DMF19_08940 [Verrucomicrobiota bacterium]